MGVAVKKSHSRQKRQILPKPEVIQLSKKNKISNEQTINRKIKVSQMSIPQGKTHRLTTEKAFRRFNPMSLERELQHFYRLPPARSDQVIEEQLLRTFVSAEKARTRNHNRRLSQSMACSNRFRRCTLQSWTGWTEIPTKQWHVDHAKSVDRYVYFSTSCIWRKFH